MAGRYFDIDFDADGRIGFIYDDAVLPIAQAVTGGPLEITRASDLEYEDGAWVPRIRDWVPGGAKCLGRFPTRGAAIEAEVAYLREALPGPPP